MQGTEKEQKPETFEEWLTDTLDPDQIRDLAEHGADSGWPGLTYTADVVETYEEYEREIWEALAEDAEQFGQTIPEMISHFGAANTMTWDPDSFKVLLVWFMAERLAHRLSGN